MPFDDVVLEQGEDDRTRWQGMVFTSEIYRDQPMRVFAWYAWPKKEGKFPAVVSIHGAGGGADLPRAKAFAAAGYACLSYDWNAWRQANPGWKPGDPLPASSNTVYCGLWYDGWVEHFCYPGPDGDWKWNTVYRSIMAGRRALTWLSLRPEVDPDKLLVEGHSWGGFQCQLLSGLDPRVKAAVASASAGAWSNRYALGQEDHTRGLKPDQAEAFFERFDPATVAHRIRCPILIRLAAADFFASVDDLVLYWEKIPGPKRLEILPAANHTFWDVETRVAWFDAWMRNGPQFPSVESVEIVPAGKGAVRVKATTGSAQIPIVAAAVAWTTSTSSVWKYRCWCAAPLSYDQQAAKWIGSFCPVMTGGPLRFFVSVRDGNGRVASSAPRTAMLETAGISCPAPVLDADVSASETKGMPSLKSGAREWRKAHAAGPIANAPELVGLQSLETRSLWDERNLYLKIDVCDTTPWQTVRQGCPRSQGDWIGVRIASKGARGGADERGDFLEAKWFPVTNADVFAEAGSGPKRLESEQPVLPKPCVEIQKNGVSLVAEIPWALLSGFVPAKGAELDFQLTVSFGDVLTDERIGIIEMNKPREEGQTGRRHVLRLE
mgnify:FL=1